LPLRVFEQLARFARSLGTTFATFTTLSGEPGFPFSQHRNDFGDLAPRNFVVAFVLLECP